MPNTIFLILMFFVEWLIIYSYAKSIYDLRNKYSTIISIVFYILLFVIYKFVTHLEVFNILFTVICNISFIFVCFQSSLKSSIFHGLALCIIEFVTEVVSIYVVSLLSNSATDSYSKNGMIYMIGAVIRHLLYFSLSRILMKISTKESSKKSWGRWFSLSILPISSVYVISAIRIITDGLVLNLSDLMVIVTSTVLLMFANIIVYYIYEQAEKSSQKLLELEMTNQKNDIDLQYLNLLEKKNETMQIMIHDYKNHMMTIEAMSDSSKVNEYIENMLGEISKYSQMGKTKNKILDVILSKYTEICADKQIEFEVNIMSDNLSFISDTDISSLFNNILDNAVESAENSTDKLINLQISNSLNSYHKIVAINSCDNQPNSKNGKLISTKNNKDIHGFGTKSIEKIVNNYNGEAQWKYDDIKNQFELMILIPIEQ